jgi:integrase
MNLPLSKHIVSVLSNMQRQLSGPVFPMTANAVDQAWDGVREKAGLKSLQFRDIRHLGATALARRGHSASELQHILGHKTSYMADVYVNLVSLDVLNSMDAKAVEVPVFQIPPPVREQDEEVDECALTNVQSCLKLGPFTVCSELGVN